MQPAGAALAVACGERHVKARGGILDINDERAVPSRDVRTVDGPAVHQPVEDPDAEGPGFGNGQRSVKLGFS